MREKVLLLLEENPETADMVVAWLEKCNVAHEAVVAHEATEALDYLYATGAHRGRDVTIMPTVILLAGLRSAKTGTAGPGSQTTHDALEVLRQVRNDPRTRLLPIVVLSSSDAEADLRNTYELGANSCVRIPADPLLFAETIKQLGSYWLRLNEPPAQSGAQ